MIVLIPDHYLSIFFTSFPGGFSRYVLCIISFSSLVKYISRVWHLFLFAPVDHITSTTERAYMLVSILTSKK